MRKSSLIAKDVWFQSYIHPDFSFVAPSFMTRQFWSSLENPMESIIG